MSPNEDKNPDLRVRRTRMLIEKAFMELLNERDFQAITVQDIADRAMINRATFYDHYVDKYALFEHSVQEMFRKTLESKLPPDFTYCESGLEFLIVTVCEFVLQIDEHCRNSHPQGLPSFDEQIIGLVSETLSHALEPRNVQSAALLGAMASWAIYGAARHWRSQPERDPAENFARQIAPMVSAIIEQETLVDAA